MNSEFPVLYSFRRCPYAIRARMALAVSGFKVVLREIKLSQKPPELIRVSAKATVPVLVLADGGVFDESLDIMLLALGQHDPEGWLDNNLNQPTQQLIDENDTVFKSRLDCYKYADRYPQFSQLDYRLRAELCLQKLEGLLQRQKYLLTDRPTLADIAIMPFVRQFAGVEPRWFETSPYQCLRTWLNGFSQSDLFLTVMTKYPLWKPGEIGTVFPRD